MHSFNQGSLDSVRVSSSLSVAAASSAHNIHPADPFNDMNQAHDTRAMPVIEGADNVSDNLPPVSHDQSLGTMPEDMHPTTSGLTTSGHSSKSRPPQELPSLYARANLSSIPRH